MCQSKTRKKSSRCRCWSVFRNSVARSSDSTTSSTIMLEACIYANASISSTKDWSQFSTAHESRLISPLLPNRHYTATEHCCFNFGECDYFERWKSVFVEEFIPFLTINGDHISHDFAQELLDLRVNSDQTIFGPVVCEKIYSELSAFKERARQFRASTAGQLPETRFFLTFHSFIQAFQLVPKDGCLLFC